MIENILISILGSAAYDIVKGCSSRVLNREEDAFVKSIYDSFEKAAQLFFERYGNDFGKPENSFLARKENWDKVLASIYYSSDPLSGNQLSRKGFGGAPQATEEAIDFFLKVLDLEMRKHWELDKILAEKNSITKLNHIEKKINNKTSAISYHESQLRKLLKPRKSASKLYKVLKTEGAIFSIDSNLDNSIILIASYEGAAYVADPALKLIKKLNPPEEGEIWGASCDPLGNYFVLGSYNHKVYIFDRYYELVNKLSLPGRVRGTKFIQDTNDVLAGCCDGFLYLLDLDLNIKKKFKTDDMVNCLDATPDGRFCMVVGYDSKVRLLNGSLEELSVYRAQNYTWGIKISIDGTRAYATSFDHKVYCFDLVDDELYLNATIDLGYRVRGIATDAYQSTLAVAAENNTVLLLDHDLNAVESIKLEAMPRGIYLAKDGNYLYIGCDNHTCYLYRRG